jgi:hypothetical protein
MLPALAFAETLYVTERLVVSVYGAPAEGPAVRTVEAGAAVEVLERGERFTRVRDRQGMDGWIDSRYLVADVPARAQLARTSEEVNRLRRELTDAQGKLKKAEAELGQQTAKSEALSKRLADAAAKPAVDTPPVAPTPPPVAPPSAVQGERGASLWAMDFSLSWLLLAFAMLGTGFATGVVWLRESIKRRSGGMYLRV